jgi:hypothetical protein
MRRSGLIVCAAIGALATYGRDASAADHAHGARWIVGATGSVEAGCVSEREAFEHEVGLACAAMGTCQIVADAGAAELRAMLVCPSRDEPWRLELRTVEGRLVSSTELAGDRDDRLREAAMEVARDQAPERTLAAESLRNTLGEGDKIKKPWKPPPMSLAFGGAGSAASKSGLSGGARAVLGVQIANGAHATLGLTGLMGGRGAEAIRHLRSGVGLAFGAPFDGSIFGFVLEGGVAMLHSYQTETGQRSTKAETITGAYGQGGLVLALPIREIRPYVAVVAGLYAEPRATPFASADAGFAFPLF